ncbi:hypothetical protein [Peribacillus simplex]|uniref:Transposase n=1 Tax=Peribacillus simplex TaxID=1478 RepID=A0AAW7IDE8_9BACI|nr:hypothetical protein [Peribacillus simplex]MDM5453545.1 hypothetical protein [Peribacillus simplex]
MSKASIRSITKKKYRSYPLLYWIVIPLGCLVLHTNLGLQYTSSEFKFILFQNHLIKQFFSQQGCPYDNGCIESLQMETKSITCDISTIKQLN